MPLCYKESEPVLCYRANIVQRHSKFSVYTEEKGKFYVEEKSLFI